jgi:4-alpha-glucanotransferase
MTDRPTDRPHPDRTKPDWATADVSELAARWSIDTGFTDAHGQPQQTDPDIIRRIAATLEAAGMPPADLAAARPEAATATQAFQGDGRRVWLLAVQLYGIRSRRNWGHGDFGDLAALVELAAEVGAAGIGLNPLHALFLDRPAQASPYSPNSRLFLNPLYIDLDQVPEFPGVEATGLVAEIARLRDTDMVDYEGVARAKLHALRMAYGRFPAGVSAARRQDFQDFQHEQQPALERFAAFEVLRRRLDGPWWEWPEHWRAPSEQALDELRHTDADELGFYQYLQWIADRQLRDCQAAARRRGLAIGLYLDAAVGIDGGGADAWTAQDAMLNGLSVGAPPDVFNTGGQDWGLTTFNPHGLVALGFEPLRQLLSAVMRAAGAIRLDHVLGLMRLYVIPHGSGARSGAYLRFPFEAMLAVVAEESMRHRCIVIGEDLGTVPDGFRDRLAAWGLWSYSVMLFEREWDGRFRPPEHYPTQALTTFATHDLATFVGWHSGHDLATKRGVGIDPGESDEERQRARDALHERVPGAAHGDFAEIAAFLAATPTRLLVISIEDVLEVRDQINVPTTMDEHPNWQRRLPVALEDLSTDQRLLRIAAALARAGRGTAA